MISVAMTTYNGEKFLKEQMDSILNQTYKNIELVVCDDCSTDSTWTILQEYQQKDVRIRCYKNTENLGFKKNFEKAISLCNGEFIALSDQDDIWIPEKLEVSLKNLWNEKTQSYYDIVCSDAELIDEKGNSMHLRMKKDVQDIDYIPEDSEKQFLYLLFKNFVQGSTVLGGSSFFKKNLPVPDFQGYHDWWFAQKAVVSNGIKYINIPLLLYRSHSDQQTGEKEKKSLKPYNRSKDVLYKSIQKQVCFIKSLIDVLDLSEEKKIIIQNAIRYIESKKYKDWFYVSYLIKNCSSLCFTRNPLKKIMFLVQKIAGALFRRKNCEKRKKL